jgi:hypothetical protein
LIDIETELPYSSYEKLTLRKEGEAVSEERAGNAWGRESFKIPTEAAEEQRWRESL